MNKPESESNTTAKTDAFELSPELLARLALNPKDIEEARLLASTTAYEFKNSSKTQAENMAKLAEIELQFEEIRLYCGLREQMPPSMGGRAEDKEEAGRRAYGLSDHELLAAVLSEFDDATRLHKFLAAYPNIF